MQDPRFIHLLGRKIECEFEGERRVGKLTFAGINDKLHGQFQVTIDRTPLWPVDPRSIKLWKPEFQPLFKK